MIVEVSYTGRGWVKFGVEFGRGSGWFPGARHTVRFWKWGDSVDIIQKGLDGGGVGQPVQECELPSLL